jgi:hypothetical protein
MPLKKINASYDGMNTEVIVEGSNAPSAMLVTSVVRHTLERVWSPDLRMQGQRTTLTYG